MVRNAIYAPTTNMVGARTSQYCELDQTLLAQGAYTVSNYAPVQK